MVFLQALVFFLSTYVLISHVLAPRAFSVKSSFEYRYFVLFNIVILLGYGSILAYNLPETNSVLKRVLPGGFEWGLFGVAIFLFFWVFVGYLFDKYEVKYDFTAIKSADARKASINMLFLFFCLMFASTILVVAVYGVPQKLLFSGMSAADLAITRTAGLHNSNLVPTLVRRLFAKELSILLSFIFLARSIFYCSNTPFFRSKTNLLLVASFLCAVYNVSFELSKSKLVAYLLIYYLVYCSCRYYALGKKPKLVMILLIPLFLFLLLVVIFSLTYPEYNLSQLLQYLASRLFVSQISPYYYAVGLWVNDIVIARYYEVVLYLGEVFKVTSFQAPAQRLTELLFYDAYASGKMNYLSSFLMADVVSLFGFFFIPLFSIYISFIIRFFVFIRVIAFPKELFFGMSGAIFYGSNFMSSFFPYLLSSSVIFLFVVILFSAKRTGFILKK